MKILFSFFLLFTIHFSLFTAYSQTWQELMDSTNAYMEKQDFQTALQWAEKAEAKAKIEFGEKDTNYIASLNSIYGCYYYMGIAEKAIEYCEKAKSIIKEVRGEESPEYAEAVGNLGAFYQSTSNYEKAEQYSKEALNMCRRKFKDDHPELARAINNMASFYKGRGRFAEAEPLFTESLNMHRRIFKDDQPELARAIINLADFYNGRRRYAEAEPLFTEGLNMCRRIFKDDHPELARAISNVAYFYNSIGRFAKAEPLFTEALNMYRSIFKDDHPELANSINNNAAFYYFRGRYAEAEPLFTEALNMYKRIFKDDHPELARAINNIASFYQSIGRYTEAELKYNEALDMNRRLFKGVHPYLVASINNAAYFYHSLGRYTEAEPLYNEALDMNRRLLKDDNTDLAASINNMASFYQSIGRYAEAEPLYNEALVMYRNLYKDDNTDLASSINNMASFYQSIGRYAEAEPLYHEALEMYRNLFKGDHPALANSINNTTFFYFGQGNYKQAEPLFCELMTVCNNMMNNYFPSLSEKEKEQFFNSFSKYYLQFNNFAVSRYNESPKLLETMFDNQLLTKGMLLSSSNKIRNSIISSKDSSLIELFSDWKDKKEYIAKLYQLSKAQLVKKNINLDSIINSANEQEKELTKRSEVFRQEYDKQKLRWKDIQNSLGKDEAVVEIVRINFIDKKRLTDTVYYAALILKKNSKVPELVLLKNGKELENDYISNYYKSIQSQIDDNSSFEQFWKPIGAKLKGIKKVYISSDGVYNQINLATLKNPKTGKYLLDEKDIVLLSSSRDLMERKEISLNDSLSKGKLVVELFGDPLFNLDSTKHLELASAILENRTRDFYYLGNTLDSTTRGGIRPLPSTRTEIEQIANEFTKKGWKVNTHLGEKALEEAVKGVDNPKVLHIATHGKFLKDVEVKEDDRMLGMETKRVAENPLLRSFLLFSGAENTLNNQKLENQNTDDGLLTAYEAMNLNLDNTDLVVLSACETGLGEIKNGEGVYGLQRAFQQAGAKSIIMSLWTVPDKETQELMTSFYSKWLNGKDKRTAFNEARNEMRDKYHYPYYWGGFVMVGK